MIRKCLNLLICWIKIILFRETLNKFECKTIRSSVHLDSVSRNRSTPFFGLQNDGDMGEMGSLLSLMIQGRKIEFRFGGVRLFLPGSYKALASFSTRDVDRWVSTIQPRYLFARQPTPDLRFNQKPFDVPSDDASLYLRFRRRANTSFKLHPLETRVNGTDISRLCAVYR